MSRFRARMIFAYKVFCPLVGKRRRTLFYRERFHLDVFNTCVCSSV